MKRLVSLVLIMMMAISCVSASAFEYIKEYDEADYDWLLDTSDCDLTVYYVGTGTYEDENSIALQRVYDATGINVHRMTSGDSDGTGLMLLLASGEMPDIIYFYNSTFENSFLSQAIAADAIWALDDLIDEYAPHFSELVPSYLLTDFQWEDGKTYQMKSWLYDDDYYTALLEYGAIDQQNCSLIRKDWYEEAGSPDVSTPDGFVSTLLAIKENHPEAYGWCTPDLRNGYPWKEFEAEFGTKPYAVMEDGTVRHKAYSNEAREAALFLNRLYREGLLRKDNMIEGGDECQSYVYAGKTIAYRWNTEEYGKPVDNGGENAYYICMQPFNTFASYLYYDMSGTTICISKNTEHPDRAIRFLEYIWSQAGAEDLYWGVEGPAPEDGGAWTGDYVNGPHYFVEKDSGKPTYYSDFIDVLGSDWNGTIAKSGLKDFCISETLLVFSQLRWSKDTDKFSRMLESYGGKVLMAPEFSDIAIPGYETELCEIRNDINAMFKTYTAKIVFAETEEEANAMYDEMLATADSMGEDKLDAVYTAQYEANVEKYAE